MTMSDGALDLSVSSYGGTSKNIARPMDHVTRLTDHVTRPMDHVTRPMDRVTRPLDHVSSDSGRASSDSTSSETHEDIKPIIASSPNGLAAQPTHSSGSLVSSVAAGPIAFPTSHLHDLPQLSHIMRSSLPSASPPHHLISGSDRGFSNPSSPGQVTSLSGDDIMKSADRMPDPRAMGMKPFKMYPMDPFGMYNNPLMAGATGALSPSPAAFQSLYDSVSPSGFPSFPMTPLTSHLLQRKRRAENRDHTSGTSTTATTTTTTAATNSNSGYPSGGNVSGGEGNGSSRVSTSSPVSQGGEDSNGSDGEKRKRSSSSADVKKDDAYWDRRRKNNEAAKRSRDARRQKEEEIAMRAAFLEQENLKLRAQVAILKNETAKLHYMLYNRI